ncbi:MAG: LytTR family DNA-binding domain-containing protein [Bacteroidota bacterium]
MKYQVLIADDEKPAQDLLVAYVEKIPELEILAVVNNGMNAKSAIHRGGVDIFLSDIQMDDLKGIEVLRTLRKKPVTIFTTAYSEYALDGYELDIIDYLVKPISFQRFCKAIDKAIELIQYTQSAESQGEVPLAIPTQSSVPAADYFFVKTSRKIVKLAYEDILFVQSYGEYVKIYTRDDVLLALQKTSFMEEMLPAETFKRIHRSYIINIDHIKEIEGNQVRLDTYTLPISKRMKDPFLDVIQRKGLI